MGSETSRTIFPSVSNIFKSELAFFEYEHADLAADEAHTLNWNIALGNDCFPIRFFRMRDIDGDDSVFWRVPIRLQIKMIAAFVNCKAGRDVVYERSDRAIIAEIFVIDIGAIVGSAINNFEDQIVAVFRDPAADDLFWTDIGAENHWVIADCGAELVPESARAIFRLIGVVNAVLRCM